MSIKKVSGERGNLALFLSGSLQIKTNEAGGVSPPAIGARARPFSTLSGCFPDKEVAPLKNENRLSRLVQSIVLWS
jgi:hypothetical protein